MSESTFSNAGAHIVPGMICAVLPYSSMEVWTGIRFKSPPGLQQNGQCNIYVE